MAASLLLSGVGVVAGAGQSSPPTVSNDTITDYDDATVKLVASDVEVVEEDHNRAPLDISFVLDESGSMRDNDPAGKRHAATRHFIDMLNDSTDRAGVVNFDYNPGNKTKFGVPSTPRPPARVIHPIDSDLQSVKNSAQPDVGGGTNITAGIRTGTGQFTNATANGQRTDVMVLLSDGKNTYKRGHSIQMTRETMAAARAAANQNITIYTVGLGDKADDALLKNVAQVSGGTYTHTDDADELKDTFEEIAKEIQTTKTNGSIEAAVGNGAIISENNPATSLGTTSQLGLDVRALDSAGSKTLATTGPGRSNYTVYTDGDSVPNSAYLNTSHDSDLEALDTVLENNGLTTQGDHFDLTSNQAVIVAQFGESPYGYGVYLFEEQGYDLDVTVVDENGNALDGATVTLDGSSSAVTGGSGSVTFNNLPNDQYTIDAEKSGYTNATQTVTINGDDESVTLVLKEKTADLTVEVRDQDGDAVTNARVPLRGNTFAVGMTDANGETTFTDVPAGNYTVEADKNGYYRTRQDVEINHSDKRVILTISEKTYDLDVTVRDQNGTALDGATVDLTGHTSAQTGSNGGVTFTNLTNGDYTVTADKNGYQNSTRSVVIDGDNESVTIVLYETQSNLTVEVTDQAGNPLADADVTVDNGTVGSGVTDANGETTITALPDGTYLVTADKNGYHSETRTVGINGNDERVTIALTAKTYDLDVTVRDQNGTALDGAAVDLAGQTSAQTGSNGGVTFTDLANGDYRVTADKNGYQNATKAVTINGSDEQITLTLSPETYDLDVTVRDQNGAALDGATVDLVGQTSAQTDSTGEVTFANLTNGDYTVTADKNGYQDATQAVTINGGDEQITLILGPKTYDLTVNVIDDSGGDLENASVTVTDTSGNTVGNGDTNAGGSITVSNLSDGDYDVEADKSGYGNETKTVQINGGDEHVTVQLTPTLPNVNVPDAGSSGNGGAGVSISEVEITLES